jgi:polar amino acid transport system substrate-binding protein
MNFKTAFAAAVVGLMALAPVGAFADKLEDILNNGTVRVGVLADSAPWGFRDGAGELTGFDIGLAELIAADLGVELQIVEVTGAARIPSLLSDQIDVLIAAAGATPERAQQVMFTAPYVATDLGVFGPADAPGFQSAADMAGTSIAVARGTTLDVWLTDNAPGANIVRFEDAASALAAFAAGQTQYFAENSIIAKNAEGAANLELKFRIRQSPAHIAVSQGEHNLLQWLNTDLFYNRLNGKLDALQVEFFGEASAVPNML